MVGMIPGGPIRGAGIQVGTTIGIGEDGCLNLEEVVISTPPVV